MKKKFSIDVEVHGLTKNFGTIFAKDAYEAGPLAKLQLMPAVLQSFNLAREQEHHVRWTLTEVPLTPKEVRDMDDEEQPIHGSESYGEMEARVQRERKIREEQKVDDGSHNEEKREAVSGGTGDGGNSDANNDGGDNSSDESGTGQQEAAAETAEAPAGAGDTIPAASGPERDDASGTPKAKTKKGKG